MIDGLMFGDWFDTRNWVDDEKDSALPKSYEIRVLEDSDELIPMTEWRKVTPRDITKALRYIASAGNPANLTDDIVESCKAFLNDPDSAAASRFDSICADAALQIITMGKVEFG